MNLSAEALKLYNQIIADPEGALRTFHGGGLATVLLRELYANRGDVSNDKISYFLAGYPETPSKFLEEMAAASDSVKILALLAENPRTPKTVLQQLARHEQVDVRRAVAAGKSISPQTAMILCNDEDASVRSALAENPSITARVQAILSDDPVPFVRASLLKLSRLDEEIQLALCDDRDITVQAKALLARQLSETCLLRYADSDDTQAQRLLLQRKQLPEKVLESLLFSEDHEVQLAAVCRKSLTSDEMVGLARSPVAGIRERIASLSDVPELVQQLIAEDSQQSVRLKLAENPAVRPVAVTLLQKTGDDAVDDALALNEHVDLEDLEPAIERRGQVMLRMICCRDLLTEADKVYLLTHGDEGVLYHLGYNGVTLHTENPEALKRLCQSPLPRLREMGARSSGLTIAQMSELLRDASTQVRMALAENPEVLESHLDILMQDADSRVSQKARMVLTKRRASALSVTEEEEHRDGLEPEASVRRAVKEPVAEAAEDGCEPQREEDEEEVQETGAGGLFKRIMKKLGK